MGSHLCRIIIQLVVFFCTFIHSQSVEPQFNVLPVGIPNCVLHDSRGFIWIGAQVGLFRYDGYEIKYYQPEPFDSTSLSANYVSAIQEDAKGNLWIGTWGGLNYFDQRTEKFTRYMDDPQKPDDIGSNSISHILVNRDGSLWLGTTDNGFTYLSWRDNGKPVYRHYNHKSIPRVELTNNYVPAMYLDRENILWVGSDKEGLIRFDPSRKEIRYFRNDPANPASLSDNAVSAICDDDSGYLWIGTGHPLKNSGNGLNRFDRRTETFRHYKNDPEDPFSLCSNFISCLEIDRQGLLWIGTEDGGVNSVALKDLYTHTKPEFRRYSNFRQKIINKIYCDRLDNNWIAPLDMQVYKFDRQQSPFIYYGPIRGKPDGMKDSGIECLYIDKKGNIWFGHHFSGLDKYDPVTGRYTHFPHLPGSNRGPSSGWINGICEDADGNFWIGTSQNGLDRYDPQTGIFTNIRSDPSNPQGLKSDNIRCLISRGKGGLWLSSQYKGLQIFDTRKQIFHKVDLDSSATHGIHTLYEDTFGKLWIGTLSNGIYRLTFDQEQLTGVEHFVHDPHDLTSLGNNNICDMVQTQVVDSNALWIATDNGLERLDLVTGTFTHLYERDGLPGNYVLSVLEDNSGDIWVSTTRGIGRISLRTHSFRSYGEGDGLPFISFGGARQNTAKSADGQLFFSGADGTVGIYPDWIKDNPYVPPVRLTDFRIFHERVKLDTAIQFKKTITLRHDQNAFSFTFAALNFTNPEKNQYTYKMEGFHKDWIPVGNERTASFTNLDPGQYIFRVKGSNNHGVWNEEGASVQVIILPPWWRTDLAYLVYFLLLGSMVYVTWRMQMKRIRIKHEYEMSRFEAEKLHEVDEIKTRFFTNISHEFRTPLTLILGPVKQMMEVVNEGKMKDDLSLVHRNTKKLLGLVNQLLDISKLESGNMKLACVPQNLIPLLKALVLSFASYAERKRITLAFHSTEDEIIVYLDKDKVEKIITNVLSNAFKFTPEGGSIEVYVRSRSGYVDIKVSDTGIGIPTGKLSKIFDRFYQVDGSHTREQEGTGIGLSLTRELIELHKGSIEVESEEGKGTIVTISFPLGKTHLKPEEINEAEDAKEYGKEQAEYAGEGEYKAERKIGMESFDREALPLLLIVEDNADVRKYIRDNLIPEYRVLEAKDGEDGWNKSVAHIPDLIVSDVMMPKMDGFRLCAKLKTDERTSHIPVILLTAKAAKEDKLAGYQTGADEYLMKPFEPDELRARVKNLIEQRKRLHEHFRKKGMTAISQTKITSVDKQFLQNIFDDIERHLSDTSFSVDVLVRDISISRPVVHRKILSLTGETPGELIRRIRLNRAAEMIQQNFGNLSAIALEVGFSNPAHFSEAFKKQFGVSPSHFNRDKKTS